MWHIRNKENEKGLSELKAAAGADPSNAQFAYGYAIGLFPQGLRQQSVTVLEQFVSWYGHQPLVLDGLVAICRDLKFTEKAGPYEALRREFYGY